MVVVKSRMHELLKIAEITEKPGIIFLTTSRQVMTDLPVIPADSKGSDELTADTPQTKPTTVFVTA